MDYVRFSRFPFASGILLLHLLAAIMGHMASPVHSAVITIINEDEPGEGLNDTTSVLPIGGNQGVTLGEQRWIVMQRAAEIWGARLVSPVEIEVSAAFNSLSCDTSSATLGQARASTFFRDFEGAPRPGTLYAIALANMFAGRDLDPGEPDILAVFNKDIGTAGCVPSVSWYYGLDGNSPSGSFDFLQIVLHELVHGFGFSTLINLSTGAKINGYDDAYMLSLEDHSTGKLFPEMSNAERLTALADTGDLHWAGSEVIAASDFLNAGRHPEGHVEIYAPNPASPGSSLSHFSTSLSPNELMEPFASRTYKNILSQAALRDMGWVTLPDTPEIISTTQSVRQESCSPGNLAPDPGESVIIDFGLKNIGEGLTENLVATLLPSPQILQPGPPQSYGTLPAGGESVARSFDFTVSGECGGTITAVLQLQDGDNDLGTVTFDLVLGFIPSLETSYANPATVAIPASGKSGPASPYPSAVTVAEFTNVVTGISLTLTGLTHDNSADLDVLLVGPDNTAVLLMSDAGSGSLSGVNLTFDDQAGASLPSSGGISSGTYRPTNYGANDSLPSPAPSPPYQTSLDTFAGKDPNGSWQLFILDDRNPGSGVLSGGWAISIASDLPAECCLNSDNQADVTLAMRALSSTVSVQSNITFHITTLNNGPDPAAGLQLSNTLPANTVFQSAQTTQGSCAELNGILTCDLGSLLPGAQTTVALTLTALTPGPLTNQATVLTLSTDPNPTNNLVEATVAINAPPEVDSLQDLLVMEDTTLGPVILPITDADTPLEELVVTAVAADTSLIPPAGLVLSFNGSAHTLTISPAVNQNGLTGVLIYVSDGFATVNGLALVEVAPVNDPPVLEPLEARTGYAGNVLVITNQASDVDNATETLRFSLDPSLEGASIDPSTGLLTWTLPESLAGISTNLTVTVTDDGDPPRSDSQLLTVTVLDQPRILSIQLLPEAVNITWESVPGQSYRIQHRADLQDSAWNDLPALITADSMQTSEIIPITTQSGFFRVMLTPP